MKRWQKVLAVGALSLIVVVAVLLFVLDSIITSKARDQAAQLSKEWGRPVTIGSVSTKLITGLGVNVSDLRIGAAEGEGAPLLDLKRVSVKAALLRRHREQVCGLHPAELRHQWNGSWGWASFISVPLAETLPGKVKPGDPVPVKLRLTGPAWNPSLTDLDLKPAVEMIARQAGSALLGTALPQGAVREVSIFSLALFRGHE
jgi:hypothetical protein